MAEESKSGALKISSREELQKWLESLRPEQEPWVAVAIAARAVLRGLPLLASTRWTGSAFTPHAPSFTLPAFLAGALARMAARFPNLVEALPLTQTVNATAARLPEFGSIDPGLRGLLVAANGALVAVARAAKVVGYNSDFRTAITAAAYFHAADPFFHAALRQDVTFIASGGSPETLASQPLWPELPHEMATRWQTLRDALPHGDNWQVWIDWYNRRLEGVSDPEEIEFVFASVPDKEREAGPAAANKWIADELKILREKNSPAPPAWDFFISYSTLDEADAREVAAVLEQAGHTTIAQFKDIATGNNFVREMQSGLDDSGRMIALYSPEYENSDHCQAEWSAAYNSDPSGKKRKLIPFLLRPTALNSLARQVAYKSLVGLSKEERKKAILDAIAPKLAKRNIAQVRAELAETASPQPTLNEDKQLNAGPNKVFDKPFVDHELVELPYTQRRRIETILSALPRNAPSFIGSALRSYDKELKERGSQPIIDLLNDFASALEREIEEIKATEPELLGPGNASLFEAFFRKHALLATHFPLKNEEKFADIPIDEERATGDALAQPIKDVAEKMNDAVESGLATENIGKIVSNSAQFASDIAPLPPDASASEPGSRRVTLKRRYVLGTLGFLVALYNLLGSTASILATEQGAALFEAVRKAIEALSKFLL